MEQKRKATRVHTRKIDRFIARRQMENVGMRRVCSHGRHGKHSSYFASHWREYCVGGKQ